MNYEPLNIGIIGSGYVANHFYRCFHQKQNLTVTKAFTRRSINECSEFPNKSILTNNLNEVIDHADVIYECSGDPINAASVIEQCFAAGKPVVTTNTEFHVTCGSYFINKGLLTEADGDQPGALAALHEQAIQRGFKPLAYLNLKGFLNKKPNLEDMKFWAAKNGISIPSVTSFTDGTKIQFEQALVANGCNANFYQEEMIGLEESSLEKVKNFYGNKAHEFGQAISDYIIYPGAPHAVFVIAEHQADMQPMLRYVKLGDGPYYLLRQDAILIHMDAPLTIRRLLETKRPLLNNSLKPKINVAAIAKTNLEKDHVFKQPIGGFEVRGAGIHIENHPNAVPIGLLSKARLKHQVEKDQIITFDDVEIPQSVALKGWQWTLGQVMEKEESQPVA